MTIPTITAAVRRAQDCGDRRPVAARVSNRPPLLTDRRLPQRQFDRLVEPVLRVLHRAPTPHRHPVKLPTPWNARDLEREPATHASRLTRTQAPHTYHLLRLISDDNLHPSMNVAVPAPARTRPSRIAHARAADRQPATDRQRRRHPRNVWLEPQPHNSGENTGRAYSRHGEGRDQQQRPSSGSPSRCGCARHVRRVERRRCGDRRIWGWRGLRIPGWATRGLVRVVRRVRHRRVPSGGVVWGPRIVTTATQPNCRLGDTATAVE